MRRLMHLGIVLAVGMAAGPAFAGPIVDPTATVQSSDLGGGVFDYKITLMNSASSPAPIGTFWYSWVPGGDFMDTAPLSVTSPTGWTGVATQENPNDGFGIQWVADSASLLAPGKSLTFEFTSTETPEQLMGNAPINPSLPVGTSVVYSGGPFSDPGTQFVVAAATTVPEPSSLAFALVSGLALVARKRIGRRRRP